MKNILQRLGYQVGLIGFTSTYSFLRLSHYSIFIHPRYFGRALLVVLTSLLTAPFRVWEWLRYQKQVDATDVESPIFVIGHWRSGTTHLHNLLSQDPQFGHLSMFQAMVPGCSLTTESWLKPILSKVVPDKRPMDNMVWPIDAPQEEEIPLAKITPYSLYVRFLFPRKSPLLFSKYVLLEGVSLRITREIKRKYTHLLKVATVHARGRRLVLKNPVNTARIKLLLEMYPNAKFVHIYRSPYDVFTSTRDMHNRMLPITTLQSLKSDDDQSERSETVLNLYELMMRRYFEERTLVPEGNLAEICFEDLEKNPINEVKKIYQTLGLEGYAQLETPLISYVESQRSYKKNGHRISATDKARVEQRWGFALDNFGYDTCVSEVETTFPKETTARE